MKNALLPLDDKRYLKRCSEFDKLFRDTRQVLKKQEDSGNELATPPPKRPKTKTPRATKKIKSPTPIPATTPITNALTPDGISPQSPEKVVKKAAVSAKKTKPTKRAAKQNKQPVIPPIMTAPTEFESILKNTTDTVIMPPPPTPPPLTSPQPPPLLLKKEFSRKLLPATPTQLKPLTIQPFQPPSVQKFTANPVHSPPTVVNLSSPKPLAAASILAEAKVLPILPIATFTQGNTKLKTPVYINNYKFPSPPTSSLSPADNRGMKPELKRGIAPGNPPFKLIKTGNGNLCIRYHDGSPQKSGKQKINIQKVQIIQPPHKSSPVIMGKAPIFTTGSKPISIVKGSKFITSNVKQGSSNSNVIVLGSLPPPSSSSASPIASSSTTSSISDNIINEDTPVDILSAPIEIADDDDDGDGDSMNNHSSGIVGVTDWEMELDQETNKNKNVEVSEVYNVEEGNTEIVEYEGDESFNDVIVEEDEETIIVDDGVTDGDSNKTSADEYGE